MSKLLCEYSKREKRNLQCILGENQGCKFVRYCTQDSYWWNSSNFTSCERRKQEMAKKNKRFENEQKVNNTNSVEESFIYSGGIGITDDLKESKEESESIKENNTEVMEINIEKPIEEVSTVNTPSEEEKEPVKEKEEQKPVPKKYSTLKRVLY